jgi:predicted Ser/Thr protein kinase
MNMDEKHVDAHSTSRELVLKSASIQGICETEWFMSCSADTLPRLTLEQTHHCISKVFGNQCLILFKGERILKKKTAVKQTFRLKCEALMKSNTDGNDNDATFVVKFQPVYDCTERHFLQELRIMHTMQVQAPGVAPKVHAAWLVDGLERGCVVMERIRGVTLREWQKSHQLTNVHLMELISNVKLMHHAGVVHGDLHQDNVMVVSDASDSVRFRIIDFGEAELTPTNTKTPESDITMLLEDLKAYM